MNRLIDESSGSAELKDALHSLFVSELVHPSSELFIHTNCKSLDCALVDNSCNEFRSFLPEQAYRKLSLIDIVSELLSRGVKVFLALAPEIHESVLRQISTRVSLMHSIDSLSICHVNDCMSLGVCSDSFCVLGEIDFSENQIVHHGAVSISATNKTQLNVFRQSWEAR